MRQGAVGALDERAIDPLEVALYLLASVRIEEGLRSRFGLEATGDPQEDLKAVGARLGCLRTGGEVDMQKAAILFLRDYRNGRLGRYTLEGPSETRE
jgi:ribosome biogenesis GTPase A